MHANRVRMAELGDTAAFLWIAIGQIDNVLDPLEAENPMVGLSCRFLAKQTEEHKYIARSHTLIDQMRLCSAALAEQAASVLSKHRVMMAMVLSAELSPTGNLCEFSETEISIGRLRESSARDRQANRAARDNRRRAAASSTIKTLSAENYPHEPRPAPTPDI